MDFTSTGLINQIKRRALIPSSQNLFTNADLIDVLNEELQNRIIPYILNVREDYYLTYYEINMVGQTISELTIPENAIGNKVNQVSILQSNVQYGNMNVSVNVPRLANSQLDSKFSGYYIEGNKIKFFPSILNSTGLLRVYYYRRPSEIVDILDVGKITAVNVDTSIICQSLPSDILTGSNIDIVKSNQPWDTIKEFDNVTVNTLTIDLSDTTDILNNYYVCSRNESPFAQIPQDVIPMLAQAVVVRILEYMGDSQGLDNARKTYAQMEMDNINIISPRVDNQPKKVVNRNKLSRFMPR